MATDLPSLNTKYPALIFKQGRSPISHGALSAHRPNPGQAGRTSVCDRRRQLHASCFFKVYSKNFPLGKLAEQCGRSISNCNVSDQRNYRPSGDADSHGAALRIAVAESSAVLNRWFLFPQLPWNLPRQLADKAGLSSFCRDIGMPCAKSITPRSIDQTREFIEYTAFPMVLKAAQQWRLPNDSYYNPKVVHNRKAVLRYF